MIGPKLTPQKKFSLMEARQQEALRQEEQALEATRAKTARLKAQRLEKEYQDSLKPKKPAVRAKRTAKAR
ncbi:hypothetical protein [Pelagibacterium lentulum]|uniref:Uncharacterized protein n=1 Tax=Pelagibacterium lentulum TaxID=2029865 RepID=A0A916VVP8_9HYPH|nr:hypothetical protein [Pelagibacterium lentulum]GGA41478.1 hypothetical protein GCM10011499_08900 [Pelagibacterium lentulum]